MIPHVPCFVGSDRVGSGRVGSVGSDKIGCLHSFQTTIIITITGGDVYNKGVGVNKEEHGKRRKDRRKEIDRHYVQHFTKQKTKTKTKKNKTTNYASHTQTSMSLLL